MPKRADLKMSISPRLGTNYKPKYKMRADPTHTCILSSFFAPYCILHMHGNTRVILYSVPSIPIRVCDQSDCEFVFSKPAPYLPFHVCCVAVRSLFFFRLVRFRRRDNQIIHDRAKPMCKRKPWQTTTLLEIGKATTMIMRTAAIDAQPKTVVKHRPPILVAAATGRVSPSLWTSLTQRGQCRSKQQQQQQQQRGRTV